MTYFEFCDRITSEEITKLQAYNALEKEKDDTRKMTSETKAAVQRK